MSEVNVLKALQGCKNIVELIGYVYTDNTESHVTHCIFELYETDLNKKIIV